MRISKEKKNKLKVTPELIEHLHECMGNHPQVANLTIYNDILLVPDHKQPGKKIRVSKLLLQISISEIHNGLIHEIIIYQLKEAIDKSTGKTLISDTSLCSLMTNNFRKITDRFKQMCGYKNMCYYLLYAKITE